MRASAWVAATIALVAAGCGQPNKLEGSVEQNVSLAFDDVIVSLQLGQYFAVEYVLDDGSEIAEVTIDTVVCPIEEGVELDFPACAILDRSTIDNYEYDVVTMGTVVLFQYGGVGDSISGEFHVLFDNGLTLSGSFHGTLEDRSG